MRAKTPGWVGHGSSQSRVVSMRRVPHDGKSANAAWSSSLYYDGQQVRVDFSLLLHIGRASTSKQVVKVIIKGFGTGKQLQSVQVPDENRTERWSA